MIPEDEIKNFSKTCSGLSSLNLKYAIDVANALKFTEESNRQSFESKVKLEEELHKD